MGGGQDGLLVGSRRGGLTAAVVTQRNRHLRKRPPYSGARAQAAVTAMTQEVQTHEAVAQR